MIQSWIVAKCFFQKCLPTIFNFFWCFISKICHHPFVFGKFYKQFLCKYLVPLMKEQEQILWNKWPKFLKRKNDLPFSRIPQNALNQIKINRVRCAEGVKSILWLQNPFVLIRPVSFLPGMTSICFSRCYGLAIIIPKG